MWGSIWGVICLILFIIIFLICVWVVACVGAVAFSNFLFFNCSCLIKLGPYEIEAF